MRLFLLVSLLAGLVPAASASDPEIVQPPLKFTARSGGTAAFSAAVAGTPPITCTWFHDGVQVASGADTRLTLAEVQETDRGHYWLVARNAAGSVTSAPVVLTVMPRNGSEWFDPVVNNGVGVMPGMKHNFNMHSDHLVPVFARGRGAELFSQFTTNQDSVRGPFLDNTDIPRILRAAMTNGVRNVILMLSDGAGFSTYEATSYFQHGELGRQAYDTWPAQCACSTYPLNSASSPTTNRAPASTRGWYDESIWWSFYKGTSNWTDSSAAASALSCGQKTYNFSIGWSDDNRPMTNIAEIAKQAFGKKVGIVTTVPISHATPGAFSAHSPSRMAFAAIGAEQLTNTLVDVLMGAGHPLYNEDHVLLTNSFDYSYVGGADLWNSLTAGTLGWSLIQGREEFEALAAGTLAPPARLCGIAQVRTTLQQARSSAGNGQEAAYAVPFNPGVPDLGTMALGALRALDQGNPEGFFVLIEGGAVDLANHAAQKGRMIEEMVDFNRAVETVEGWVSTNGGWEQTLVIVLADHETGLLFGPTAGGAPIGTATSLRPSGIAFLAAGYGSLNLTWNAVSGATCYLLTITHPDLEVKMCASATNRFALTGVQLGAYEWTVTPGNEFGWGPVSSNASFSVLAQGLVGVGRIPATAFDARGPGLDSLGGIGSAFFDISTWRRTYLDNGQLTISGKLYCAADRGFGDGTRDYVPRIQTMDLSVTPDYGTDRVPQAQVVMSNSATLLLTCNGEPFTGYDADNPLAPDYPRSTPGSPGMGHRSLDAKGYVRLADGSFFVCDTYGACIHKFDSAGVLQATLWPPAALIPKLGGYPGTNCFTAARAPTSGRRDRSGLEGLSLTPDGTRLFTLLQGPTIQDGGISGASRYTRLVIFDVDPRSPACGLPVEEYAYPLTLEGSPSHDTHTLASEVLALNTTDFLVLERDQLGLGAGAAAPLYKRVVLASTAGATNLINSGYDLEPGAPGQLSFGASAFPTQVAPVSRTDLLDLLDPAQLARFGLNVSTEQDANTLPEKWESLALIPCYDPEATNDFLLLTLNDNDFLAPVVYQDGVAVATNAVAVDNLALVYRVQLPMYGAPRPANRAPGVTVATATLSPASTLTLTANAYDQDGRILRVDFYEGVHWLGSAVNFPFQTSVADWQPGTYDFRAVATDSQGLTSTSSVTSLTVTLPTIPATLQISCRWVPASGGNAISLSFNTVRGNQYQVWSAPDIRGPWSNLTPSPILGTGLPAAYTETAPAPSQAFYRVIQLK